MAKLFTYRIFISSFAIAVVYIIFTIYLMNFRLVQNTIIGAYPLSYKGKLLFELLAGMWTSMTRTGVFLLIVISLLTGVNLSLFISHLREIIKLGTIRFVVGGSSLLGIVGSGCATCGLPIISLLGFGSSMLYLPFHGAELSYISIVLLMISLFTLVRGQDQTCTVSYAKSNG